ncbi:uncharacterized protein LOC108203961 [Daucus carota subsp. sativus]|uniref:uncharacterized protein LOC108203961 n=3 Tax=Daucus carota subsp. sativus TaxID=79200 RepID=UPI00308324B6
MIIALMARKGKGKGKAKETTKGKGKGKAKETTSTRKGKGKSSTLAIRDEPTDSDEGGENPNEEEVPRRRVIRRPRSHSAGLFGKVPPKPIRINISGGHIEDDQAKKTLLAIVRERWPVGHYTFTDIVEYDDEWLKHVVEEFNLYFKQQKGQSRSEAKNIIEKHIKNTIKRTLNELKTNIEQKSKESGKSKLSLRPGYWSELFWKDLLNYWEKNEGHLHRSSVGSTNRKNVERLHSAGARSFNKVKEEMKRKERGKNPTRLEVWNRTHTRVGSDPEHPVYTTPAAMAIATRYASILESRPVSVTQTGDRDEPLEWWLSATGVPEGKKPKKDYLVGFPEARASQLIPTLASRYRDSTRGEAGGSSGQRQEAVIPDNVYLSVVRNVLNEVRANPLQFQRQMSEEEIANFAKTALEASDPAADPSTRVQWNSMIGGEMVHIVGSMVEDILLKMERKVEEEKERRLAAEKDYTDPEELSEEERGGPEAGADAGANASAASGADASAASGAGATAAADGAASDSDVTLD